MKNIVMSIMMIAAIGMTPACKDKKNNSLVDEKNVVTADEVPKIVRDSFASKYPGAGDVSWENAHEKEEDTYKAKFTNTGKYWKAEFKSDGSLVKESEDN